MNANQIDEAIKAMEFLRKKAGSMAIFLKKVKEDGDIENVSLSDLERDVGFWERCIGQMFTNAEIYGEESE